MERFPKHRFVGTCLVHGIRETVNFRPASRDGEKFTRFLILNIIKKTANFNRDYREAC
jgi:hypothetical protein